MWEKLISGQSEAYLISYLIYRTKALPAGGDPAPGVGNLPSIIFLKTAVFFARNPFQAPQYSFLGNVLAIVAQQDRPGFEGIDPREYYIEYGDGG